MLELITGDTFIISDHHFGHKTITEWEPSRLIDTKKYGFETFEQMIIARHNAVVKSTDVCLFLGDFSFSSPGPWISRLNGRKILILGNHDTRGDEAYFGFDQILRGIYVETLGLTFVHKHSDRLMSAAFKTINGIKCVFSHYPLWFNDNVNRSNGPEISKRMRILENIAEEFDVNIVFHGHLHSKTATSNGIIYHNTCCEQLDYEPKRISSFLN